MVLKDFKMASAKDTAVGGRSEDGDNTQPKSGLGATLGSVGDIISSYVGGGNSENKDEGYIAKGKFHRGILSSLELVC